MKTVITYGVFDLFHQGHENLLRRAKALGDRLIVGVTTDQFAYERGKYNVVEPLEVRLRHVQECHFADQVIIEDHYGQKAEDIAAYGADVFAIGDDWLGKFDHLQDLCEVVYLPRTPGISSTELRGGELETLRIGLIGCGRIARRFLREAAFVRDVQISCFYHPRPDRSGSVASFRAEHPEIPLVRTPEKLFDQADAVYIASPHETHYEYAKEALQAGCHVLCEKPMALERARAEELFALAAEKQLVLMEALKTAYCPGFLRLISLCRSGMIGEILAVDGAFTRLTPGGCREWEDKAFGGSFLELGSYLLLPVVKLLGTRGLEIGFSSVWEDGVDALTRLQVRAGERSASLLAGIGGKSLGDLVISGTKGYFRVEAPWWKTSYFEIGYEDPSKLTRFACSFEGDGMRYEIADLLHRVRGHQGRDYKLTPEESIAMAGAMEAFLAYKKHREMQAER